MTWMQATKHVKRGCGCPECRAGRAEYSRQLRIRNAERLAADPSVAEHGKASTYYGWGCRCDLCQDARLAQVSRETRQSELARFWAKVDTSGDCWLWTASLDPDGYGCFFWQGRMKRAPRAAYTFAHGAIPDGMTVDHLCFNPACVRPEHLRLLTHQENCANHRPSTHCANGHEWTPENTYRWRDKRKCRSCARATARRYEQRRRARQAAA